MEYWLLDTDQKEEKNISLLRTLGENTGVRVDTSKLLTMNIHLLRNKEEFVVSLENQFKLSSDEISYANQFFNTLINKLSSYLN